MTVENVRACYIGVPDKDTQSIDIQTRVGPTRKLILRYGKKQAELMYQRLGTALENWPEAEKKEETPPRGTPHEVPLE